MESASTSFRKVFSCSKRAGLKSPERLYLALYILRRGEAVTQRTLTPSFAGSNPAASADIYVIDPYGVHYLQKHYRGDKEVLAIRLIVDEKQRFLRMIARGDDDKAIADRMINDAREFTGDRLHIYYDLVIPNNDFTNTVEAIYNFIQCWEGEE